MNTLPGNIRLYDANVPTPNVINVAPINPYTALAIPAYYRAMDFLANNLASFPRTVQQKVDDGGSDVPHPLDMLLTLAPNGYQNAWTFWQVWFFHACHTGNGIARIRRDPQTYQPVAFDNLKPEDVAPFIFDRQDGSGPQQYYVVNQTDILPAADVIHLKRLSHDGQTGIDPVGLQSGTLRRAAMIQAYVTKFLETGTVIRGSIELPAGIDDAAADEIVNRIRRYFTGASAQRDVIVLSNGAKLNNAGLSPQDSQLVEQGSLSVKEISQITGVPPWHLFDFKDVQYNNAVESMGQDVVRYTFRPWIQQAENELTIKLLSPSEILSGHRINLNHDDLLRGDTKTQAEIVRADVAAGIITRNEGRKAKGKLPIDDPEADKLKIAGDTSPTPPPSA